LKINYVKTVDEVLEIALLKEKVKKSINFSFESENKKATEK
jgi:predicted ATP-dependent protease